MLVYQRVHFDLMHPNPALGHLNQEHSDETNYLMVMSSEYTM
jgi:hypothetical protein